jgi:hypothetical protein
MEPILQNFTILQVRVRCEIETPQKHILPWRPRKASNKVTISKNIDIILVKWQD